MTRRRPRRRRRRRFRRRPAAAERARSWLARAGPACRALAHFSPWALDTQLLWAEYSGLLEVWGGGTPAAEPQLDKGHHSNTNHKDDDHDDALSPPQFRLAGALQFEALLAAHPQDASVLQKYAHFETALMTVAGAPGTTAAASAAASAAGSGGSTSNNGGGFQSSSAAGASSKTIAAAATKRGHAATAAALLRRLVAVAPGTARVAAAMFASMGMELLALTDRAATDEVCVAVCVDLCVVLVCVVEAEAIRRVGWLWQGGSQRACVWGGGRLPLSFALTRWLFVAPPSHRPCGTSAARLSCTATASPQWWSKSCCKCRPCIRSCVLAFRKSHATTALEGTWHRGQGGSSLHAPSTIPTQEASRRPRAERRIIFTITHLGRHWAARWIEAALTTMPAHSASFSGPPPGVQVGPDGSAG